jgi:hypothetical protein
MEMKTRESNYVKCIKGENQRVFVKEEEIKERWKNNCDKLFNGSDTRDWNELMIHLRIETVG